MRNVVIHYHIFKNAGSSIDRVLASNYGSAWTTFEGKTPTSLLSAHDVEEFLASHPDIQAVSSHLARPPLPRVVNTFPIVFLRDPVDRAASVYAYERRAPSNVKSSEIAKEGDFRNYVSWCLGQGRRQGGGVIMNYQVVHLSSSSFRNGHVYLAEPDEADLEESFQFLSSIPFFGIVEEFEASLRLLENMLMPIRPDFKAENAKENVTASRSASFEEKIRAIRRDLGEEVFYELEEANRLDIRLYKMALELFKQRLSAPAFAARVVFHNQECLLAQKENALAALRGQFDALRERLDIQERALAEVTGNLREIYASNGWKALCSYYRLRDKLIPTGSLRRRMAERAWSLFAF
jgi:hypothetical protein